MVVTVRMRMCTLWLRNFMSGNLFYKWICTMGKVQCVECNFEATTENNKIVIDKGLSKLGHNQIMEYNAAAKEDGEVL